MEEFHLQIPPGWIFQYKCQLTPIRNSSPSVTHYHFIFVHNWTLQLYFQFFFFFFWNHLSSLIICQISWLNSYLLDFFLSKGEDALCGRLWWQMNNVDTKKRENSVGWGRQKKSKKQNIKFEIKPISSRSERRAFTGSFIESFVISIDIFLFNSVLRIKHTRKKEKELFD